MKKKRMKPTLAFGLIEKDGSLGESMYGLYQIFCSRYEAELECTTAQRIARVRITEVKR